MSMTAAPWQMKAMAAQTAYTPVTASRSLSKPNPTPPNPPPAKKVAWPAPVRDYVQRSFAPEAKIPGIEIPEMEVKLKTVITEAAESERMDDIDWATLPLPQQLIQQERAMASAWTAQGPSWDLSDLNDHKPNKAKKRKLEEDFVAIDYSSSSSSSSPPWRKADQQKGLGDRVTYANFAQANKVEKRVRKQQEALGRGTSKFQQQVEQRKRRFGYDQNDSTPWSSARDPTPTTDERVGPIVGTSQKLEKNYFRLVNTPKPEEIRPQAVLEKTLTLLKEKWRADGNYQYICDQFKSMRQDLTVQHIKNSFTIEVYELHARIALEWKDLGEYNQCQTQLRALYSLNLGGHPAEFLAYRILYFIHTCNRTGLNDVLADLTPELKQQPALKHALAMRSALASGNYHKFFRLYLEVPNMGAYLVDQFVTRERLAALANICKAYAPKVSIKFLTEELGFESYLEAHDFLNLHLTGTSAQDAIDSQLFTLETRKAAPVFEAAKSRAFATVDIKGQI